MKEGPLTRSLVISAAIVTAHVVKVVNQKVCKIVSEKVFFLDFFLHKHNSNNYLVTKKILEQTDD